MHLMNDFDKQRLYCIFNVCFMEFSYSFEHVKHVLIEMKDPEILHVRICKYLLSRRNGWRSIECSQQVKKYLVYSVMNALIQYMFIVYLFFIV